jgi:hypothetical protein
MEVRSNIQKPYDASSAIFTMPKKFVTVIPCSLPGGYEVTPDAWQKSQKQLQLAE